MWPRWITASASPVPFPSQNILGYFTVYPNVGQLDSVLQPDLCAQKQISSDLTSFKVTAQQKKFQKKMNHFEKNDINCQILYISWKNIMYICKSQNHSWLLQESITGQRLIQSDQWMSSMEIFYLQNHHLHQEITDFVGHLLWFGYVSPKCPCVEKSEVLLGSDGVFKSWGLGEDVRSWGSQATDRNIGTMILLPSSWLPQDKQLPQPHTFH